MEVAIWEIRKGRLTAHVNPIERDYKRSSDETIETAFGSAVQLQSTGLFCKLNFRPPLPIQCKRSRDGRFKLHLAGSI